MIKNKRNKELYYKGITLVVLVVTIIAYNMKTIS